MTADIHSSQEVDPGKALEPDPGVKPRQVGARFPGWALSAILPVFFLLLWTIASTSGTVVSKFIPTPAAVVDTGRVIFTKGYRGSSIWVHTWVSLSHVLYAFLIIATIGIPVGLAMGRMKTAQSFFDPFVEFLRPLPPLAYLSLLVIWFGIGATTQVALLVISGFAIIVTSARSAAAGVSEERIKTGRAFGASPVQTFWHVILPSTLPELITGSRVLAGMLFATIIAAEMIAARSGLGWMIMDASQFLRSDVIFVGIFIMALLGFSIDRGFRLLERWLVPWKGKD